MLQECGERLLRAIYDPDSTEEEINRANELFLEESEQSSIHEANKVLVALTEAFNCGDPTRTAFVASICEYLVDAGCDPSCFGQCLVKKLQNLFESCSQLFDACVQNIDQNVEGVGTNPELFDEVKMDKSQQMPEETLAWDTLHHLWPPAISFFERNAEYRDAAKSLLPIAKKLSPNHEGAHWIHLMVSVLTDEPILVIEPRTKLGFSGRINGIVDNFQLHTFLMDVFPKAHFWTTTRISSFMRSVIDGTGPQKTEQTITGRWNLYTWRALKQDLSLPDEKTWDSADDWIWGEGTPADIELFEGYRVILLGPSSYERSWRLQRIFDGLPASVEVSQKLSKKEVGHWLQKIAAASR
ncbi:MAG: hypothetical protein ACYS8Z_23940 [Planctomycetota bacterium]|jgi:hypothetical protein